VKVDAIQPSPGKMLEVLIPKKLKETRKEQSTPL